MRSRVGLFFRSLVLTLLLILPMVAAVLFFSAQRARQNQLRQVNAARTGIAVEAGAQTTVRLLLAVQQEVPEFLLLRIDAPARAITLCALPSHTVVQAPGGTTTLADCYMAAGPARAATLLGDTLGIAPDAYFAATAQSYAALLNSEITARVDTTALLPAATRATLGYQDDPVAELTVEQAEAWLQSLQAAAQAEDTAAQIRAATWTAFLLQNPGALPNLTEAARTISSRTLTDLRAQDLAEIEQALQYLAGQPALVVDYQLPSGQTGDGGYTLDEAGTALVSELLS